jgi:hypothetical protein
VGTSWTAPNSVPPASNATRAATRAVTSESATTAIGFTAGPRRCAIPARGASVRATRSSVTAFGGAGAGETTFCVARANVARRRRTGHGVCSATASTRATPAITSAGPGWSTLTTLAATPAAAQTASTGAQAGRTHTVSVRTVRPAARRAVAWRRAARRSASVHASGGGSGGSGSAAVGDAPGAWSARAFVASGRTGLIAPRH